MPDVPGKQKANIFKNVPERSGTLQEPPRTLHNPPKQSKSNENDEKYTRLHKRLMEKDPLTESESKLYEALSSLKKEIDEHVLKNSRMLDNESYVEKMMMKIVISELHKKHKLDLNPEKTRRINGILVKEYMNEYHGKVA